ncbi:hypothetical protein A2862_03295 [Candidatus Roizmanbacteria bacterium RIFCSPHIGHO2_01_FULL_38_41]|nr:MAG: hypothetical protein A2862_03295 [Candidatus Roizmanbacteria bacterium RIFCSPHIGHO2_01_FULL_38_41]OGK33128.1 MAG: hypothetical protein A3E10_00985 [Candidatus Roizmanbacteria bacterium RIFCSPHIGHO2_12_FULL_37_23]OGK45297.1 MAG: hypothetical protein A2956_02255 [Candidatus Roizmanbacteria bacterium RIFCSPLOWO2_01_FULL_37_57]
MSTNRITPFGKYLLCVIATALLSFLFFQFVQKDTKYPIGFIVCDSLYENCFTDAKYKDMDSCQKAVETGNWRCDSRDPNNIKCKVSTDSLAKAYCK